MGDLGEQVAVERNEVTLTEGKKQALEVVAEVHKQLERTREEQKKALAALLEKNAGCEYLQRHGLNGRTDVESFKKLIPVIEYDAIEADVARILQGDKSPVLGTEPVLELFASSGTTSGKRKVFPVTAARSLAVLNQVKAVRAFYLLEFGEEEASDLQLYFVSVSKQSETPGGLLLGSGSAPSVRAAAAATGDAYRYVSPPAVILSDDHHQAVYCHLVCGLIRSAEVTQLCGLMASGLANAFSQLKDSWEEISRDIETGELSSKITDPALREAVGKLLEKPNPELGNFIRAECRKESWEGIVLRLWPRTKTLHCVATGSMLQYVDNLNFLSGGLPIVSSIYIGSEGAYAFNPYLSTPPHQVFYVFLPRFHYFEFLPAKSDSAGKTFEDLSISPGDERNRVVDLADVEEGQEYEVVLSNGSGLWRYRIGDLVKCVGYYNKAPKFQFVGRKNVILSINTDKTEEQELVQAVTTAARLHLPGNVQLLDFTSYASVSAIPGHYVIFVELTSTGTGTAKIHVGEEALEAVAVAVESGLGEPYRRGRNEEDIAPLELKVVEPGTFAKVRSLAVQRGTSEAQYKTPRGLPSGHSALGILDAGVSEAARSPRPPPHHKLNPDGAVKSDV